jgi:prephenate dehydrogenase
VLEAGLHDRAAAYISHLPFLLAAALMSTEMCADEAGLPVRAMAASGFRDATRLAAGDVTMMLDTLLTNRRAVAEALDGFERQLAEARRLLDEPGQLEGWLEAARRERRSMFA